MKLFGPPLKEVWGELAEEISGEFVPGAFMKTAAVSINHRNFRILLDTYTVNTGKSSVTYTRMRTPFKRENDIEFKLSRKNIFSGIGSLFGNPVVSSYDYDFDDQYVIKGNDESVIREIFQNEELKECIRFQKGLVLRLYPYKPKKSLVSSELYFQMTGVLKDKEKLKNLFNMFKVLLDELIKNGVASEEEPDVVL